MTIKVEISPSAISQPHVISYDEFNNLHKTQLSNLRKIVQSNLDDDKLPNLINHVYKIHDKYEVFIEHTFFDYGFYYVFCRTYKIVKVGRQEEYFYIKLNHSEYIDLLNRYYFKPLHTY
ncbi:hypothetical protein FBZ86_1471 [Gluconacetobacter diazotrophicus]|nr:hypothetical protein FBZ86_1471 [Gluconacetobacter diazotrophicus]